MVDEASVPGVYSSTMEATLLFSPGTPKTLTTSDIVVDGFDVYELRGNLRGRAVAFSSDGYSTAIEPSDLTRTGDLKKRAVANKERAPREGLVLDGDVWITGGPGAIYRSRDRGETWKREKVTAPEEQLIGVARQDGKLVVAGMDGFLAVKGESEREDGKGWTPIERPGATRVSFSKFGTSEAYPTVTLTRLKAIDGELFVLGHGVWSVDATKAKATLVAPSKEIIVDIAKTAKGTLVAVGTKGTVLRREGKTWKAGASGKDPLVGVVPIGDDVVLVSTKAIAISRDDARTFKPLKTQPTLDHALVRYTVAVPDGQGGALVAGWRGLLVRVSTDGRGPWADTKKVAAAKAKGNAKDTDASTSKAGAKDKPAAKASRAGASAPAKPKAKNAKQEATFLADILATPADDAPRLVYADWLIEHGDPRGELIQLQCLLRREVVGATTFNPMKIDDPHPDHLALGKRESEILKKHAKEWLAPIRQYMYGWSWQRGFLSRATGNASMLPGLKAILAAHPIVEVELTGLKKADVAAIAKLELGPVRRLNLQSLRLGPKDMTALLGKNMERIEELLLSGNPIGDDGLAALVDRGHFPNLRRLAIAACDLTPAGVAVLGAAKKRLPKLASVDVGRDKALAKAAAI